MVTLGDRIRELREQKDLSLREFAKKLGGYSAAFLSDVELGRRHPSEGVLQKMARVLGTTADDLRTFDTRPPLDEIKRLAASNPEFGLALRKVVDKGVSAKELLDLAEGHNRGARKKP